MTALTGSAARICITNTMYINSVLLIPTLTLIMTLTLTEAAGRQEYPVPSVRCGRGDGRLSHWCIGCSCTPALATASGDCTQMMTRPTHVLHTSNVLHHPHGILIFLIICANLYKPVIWSGKSSSSQLPASRETGSSSWRLLEKSVVTSVPIFWDTRLVTTLASVQRSAPVVMWLGVSGDAASISALSTGGKLVPVTGLRS